MRTPTFLSFLTRTLRIKVLTRAQQVWVRVWRDGVDPVDLSAGDRELFRRMFGDVDRIPDAARHVFACIKGARVGGTWLCALSLLFSGLTIDLGGLALGETAFGVIVTPDLRLGRQALRYVTGAVDSTPELARLVVSRSTDSITLRRHDGRLITIECLPASRGGSATRGRTLFGALMDESSFFRDADTGAVNDSEVYRSIVVRILRGGQLMIISTAWIESGLLWDLVQKNHGNPTTALACILPTLVARDDERIRTIVADERDRDPDNARREFDCVPLSIGALNLITPAAIQRMARQTQFDLSPVAGTVYAAAIDPGFQRITLVIVALPPARQDSRIRYQTVVAREWEGPPDRTLGEAAQELRRFGLQAAHVDQYAPDAFGALASQHGLRLVEFRWTADNRTEAFGSVATLIESSMLELHPDPVFLADLRSVRKMPKSGGGWSIDLPRRNGRHCDYGPALASAIAAIATARPPLSEAEQFELAKRAYRTNERLGMFGMRVEYDEFGRRRYFRAAETVEQ